MQTVCFIEKKNHFNNRLRVWALIRQLVFGVSLVDFSRVFTDPEAGFLGELSRTDGSVVNSQFAGALLLDPWPVDRSGTQAFSPEDAPAPVFPFVWLADIA